MQARRGERIGWIAGWLGGFLWVLALALVFLHQGDLRHGWTGIALAAAAPAVVLFFAPWRFPATPYGRLMLAPYGLFLLCLAWAVWSYGGLSSAELSGWHLLWLLPTLIPFGSLSGKRWNDPPAGSGGAT